MSSEWWGTELKALESHLFQGGYLRRKTWTLWRMYSLVDGSWSAMAYWEFTFKTTILLTNKMPYWIINNFCPSEILFHSKPDYSYFKIFGCLCFPFLRPYNHKKLEPRSLPYVFLGYASQYKGYWCLEPFSKKIHISTHVRFNETNFHSFFSLFLLSSP